MKTSTFAIGAFANVASAHYFFETNIVNGQASQPWQYIREFTRPTAFNPIKFSSNPAEDIRDNSFVDSEDIVCNQGAFTNAAKTDVLEVAAGSEVRVKLGVQARMEHPGPALVYMSRAPDDDVKSYDGSGDWFKIFEEDVCNTGGDFTTDAWCTWSEDEMAADIPADTPDGEYLVRFEHIGVHRSHVNQPEHYVSCVQVKVTGGGSGTPGPTVQFPGAYKDTDEYATFSIYGGQKPFPMPGPAVWSSGNGGGSTGGDAGASPAPAPGGNEDESAGDDTAAPSPAPPAASSPAAADPSPAPPADGGNAGGACANQWEQCGGNGFSGPTCCSTGSCTVVNAYYSQCL
ncbi:glycosyl hydrolase family 61 domain-containing protein [Sarocladium implicatum]|nr:glycosyl hydrolase family 61 domain-containing protein [Sarocladium implicatum]